MVAPTRQIVVALGSNLGDRHAHLQYAVTRLRVSLDALIVSRFIETAPQGVPGRQPTFLNAVVVGWSGETPPALLARLRAIEDERERVRPYRGAPRTLDLDLILVGELLHSTPDLTLPHPRFRERSFVLGPLASIAPEVVDPVTGATVDELRRRLGASLLEP